MSTDKFNLSKPESNTKGRSVKVEQMDKVFFNINTTYIFTKDYGKTHNQ